MQHLAAVAALACAVATWTPVAGVGSTDDSIKIRLGGSLGFTGTYSGASKVCRNGLELLQYYTNEKKAHDPFRLPDGRRITLDLDIRDDLGSDKEVREIYEELTTNSSVDMLIGPYSSKLSTVAAAVVNRTSRVLMLHGAATPDIYEEGYPFLFSTNVMASEYMADPLRVLRAKWDNVTASGERPKMIVATSCPTVPCLFNTAVCEGAAHYGRKHGYDVVLSFSFDAVSITTDMHRVIEKNPDVFVVCGHLADSINAVVTARALGYNPKALLVTQASGIDFINAVGSPNANYILSPVSWDPRKADLTCRIFGSAGEFAEAYTKRFGTQPTYHAAGAAAAGLALLAAVEKMGKWPLTSEEVRQGLFHLSLPTFFRLIAFGPNGTLLGAQTFTQQVQPLDKSHSPPERYMKSHVALVSEEIGDLPLFPMPSWQDKELEIFPCEAGYILDQGREGVQCLECPAGTQRPTVELECRECGVGLFNVLPGQANCTKCPVGANCNIGHSIRPDAEAGYYLMPKDKGDGQPVYEACELESLCLGGNECLGANTGVQCTACKSGYTNKGISRQGRKMVCDQCLAVWVNLVFLILVVLMYSAYITLLSRMTLSTSRSVRAINSIVLKIVVNYMQLSGTAIEASSMHGIPGISVIVDLSINPLVALSSFDCLLGSFMLHYQAATLVGLIIVPLALVLNYVTFQVLFYLQLRRISQQGHMYLNPSAHTQALASDHAATASPSTEALDPAAMVRQSMKQRLRTMRDTAAKNMVTNRSRWAIVVVFFMYPIVVKMLLEAVSCVELDALRLRDQRDVECLVGNHVPWMCLSLIGLVVYGLGIPLGTFIMLFRIKERQSMDERKIFGFLYNGFQPQWYYFEVVYMVRKACFLLFAIIPSPDVRVVLMLCLSFVFLGIHIHCTPYDNRDYFVLDRLETASLLALIMFLSLELVHNIRDMVRNTSMYIFTIMNQPVVDGIVLVVCILSHLYFWLLALWGLLRNAFLKHIHFKEAWCHFPVSWFGRQLLKVEYHMNKMEYNQKSHRLDLGSLTKKERHFLHSGLCDTMEWYIRSEKKFHPGRLATCLGKAIDVCIQERKERARHLYKILKNRSEKIGYIAWMENALAEARHALQGQKLNGQDQEEVYAGRKRVKTGLRALLDQVSGYTATVEEVQNALMLCESEIMKGTESFFEIDKPGPDTGAEGGEQTGPEAEGDRRYSNFKNLCGRNGTQGDNSFASEYEEDIEEPEPVEPVNTVFGQEDQLTRCAEEVSMRTKELEDRDRNLEREARHLRAEVTRLQAQLPSHSQETNHLVVQMDTPSLRGSKSQSDSALARFADEEDDGPSRLQSRNNDMEDFLQDLMGQKATRSWRYEPVNKSAMGIRSVPSVDGPQTGSILHPGETFRVSEELQGDNDILFLRLADGRGWVFDRKPGVGRMCVRADG